MVKQSYTCMKQIIQFKSEPRLTPNWSVSAWITDQLSYRITYDHTASFPCCHTVKYGIFCETGTNCPCRSWKQVHCSTEAIYYDDHFRFLSWICKQCSTGELTVEIFIRKKSYRKNRSKFRRRFPWVPVPSISKMHRLVNEFRIRVSLSNKKRQKTLIYFQKKHRMTMERDQKHLHENL